MKKTFKIPVTGTITVFMDEDEGTDDEYTPEDRQANAEYAANDVLETMLLGNTYANVVRAHLEVVPEREVVVHAT